MATLMLTAVGTAVGGPLGAAVGGLIGNQLDRRVLGRGGVREGPRLAELAVQTSSYGTAIPKLFGTMRVAGTVIWATDLRETRSVAGGGKGQAASASYSYAASFAVLLSGRRIEGIGRIWADGRLLRGAAGDLKVKAGLRVHLGGEDQAPDPLIASAEGSVTPAYRGAAYLVWEDLPLAEFGNRIPSLTVEVVADRAAVPVGAIARAVAAEVGETPAATLAGFAAAGSVRGVLEVLAEAAGGWWAADGAGLRLCDGNEPVRRISDAGVEAGGLKGPARARSVAAASRAARAVTVSHYDPARDYQAGLQRAGRPGAGLVVRRIEMPAVLDATAAKALATAVLAREEADRGRRTVTLGLGALPVRPGELVAMEGETGSWRVVGTSLEAMAVRLTLAPVAVGSLPVATAASGRVAASADKAIGRTLLRVVETPALGDVLPAAPRLTVVAAGEGAGWRRAALLWSTDEGASWTEAGVTAAPGVLGVVEEAPPPAPATLFDNAGALLVRLAREDMRLADADDAALDRGENLAVVGRELIQFGRAESLGKGQWRLTRLLRGRRGTEAPAALPGDGFALLTAAAARVIDLPLAALGRTVRVIASGVGDERPVETEAVLAGASLRPPAPVHLRVTPQPDGGVVLHWVRRSRAGWRWTDGVDVPLVEEGQRYRVVLTGAGGAREVEVADPWLALSAGELASAASVAVSQRGTWAESRPAVLRLSALRGEEA